MFNKNCITEMTVSGQQKQKIFVYSPAHIDEKQKYLRVFNPAFLDHGYFNGLIDTASSGDIINLPTQNGCTENFEINIVDDEIHLVPFLNKAQKKQVEILKEQELKNV